MTLDEIINRAIPINFPYVKCAAKESELKAKAEYRRIELKKEILTLLENKDDGNADN